MNLHRTLIDDPAFDAFAEAAPAATPEGRIPPRLIDDAYRALTPHTPEAIRELVLIVAGRIA